MSSYTRGVPIRGNEGRESQPVLFENTNALDEIYDIDHYAFSNNTTDRGKHKSPRFVDQTSEGDPAVEDDEFAIYAKENDDSVLSLFYRDPSGTVVPLTSGADLNLGFKPVAAVNFQDDGTLDSSFNVTSVTKVSTGIYQVNFTSAISDANYLWSITGMGSSSNLQGTVNQAASYGTSVTTTFLRVRFYNVLTGSATNVLRGSVVIYR